MIKLVIFNLSSRALAPGPAFAAPLNAGARPLLCRAFASRLQAQGPALPRAAGGCCCQQAAAGDHSFSPLGSSGRSGTSLFKVFLII